MQEELKIYEVPQCNMDLLQTKIDKLNRKAKKLNCSQIIINILGTVDKKPNCDRDSFYSKIDKIRYNRITITGKAPIINNWELIASCEGKENGTLIKSIPGKEYPERYRQLLICEHCNSDRYRKYTYIVQHIQTLEYKMVGKSCLKDFLGHVDPKFYANMLEYLIEPDFSKYDDISLGGGSKYIETDFYLSFVAACIREKGWTSRSKAQEEAGYYATASLAIDAIHAQIKPVRDRYGNIIPYPVPNEKDIEFAKNALNWAKSLTGNLSDYLYNINLLAHEENITHKDFGFAASIVSSYIKHIERQIEQERKATATKEQSISNYVGEIKQRKDFTLTYVNSFSFETDFGTTFIHKFLDNNGNVFVWKTTNSLGQYIENEKGYTQFKHTEQGEQITVKGTIKDHIEYRGERQTHITRCKVLN